MDILLALFDSTLGRARSCLDWRKVVVLRVLSVACFHIVRLFINLAAAPTVFGNFPEVARSLVPIGLLGMLVSVKANLRAGTTTSTVAHQHSALLKDLGALGRAVVVGRVTVLQRRCGEGSARPLAELGAVAGGVCEPSAA